LVLFFKKEPLSLPLAFRGGDLHTWAVTRKKTLLFLEKELRSAPDIGSATRPVW
jgi:hypothetical protein